MSSEATGENDDTIYNFCKGKYEDLDAIKEYYKDNPDGLLILRIYLFFLLFVLLHTEVNVFSPLLFSQSIRILIHTFILLYHDNYTYSYKI